MMKRDEFEKIKAYMLHMADESAHDHLHVYRVLYQAMKIAEHYTVDRDVLIAACLLHDVGRKAQFVDKKICHAQEGSRLAYEFMQSLGWEEHRCQHIRDCILTHRFRSDNPPQTLEAKILFDADKLDVTGALGIARTLAYEGQMGEPLCRMDENFKIHMDASREAPPSFVKEYHFKLTKLYDRFYTPEAEQIARKRRCILDTYYEALMQELDISDMEEILDMGRLPANRDC